ncbi:MAG: PQQ-binding-like beta-propeller repeat protein [Planctomycetota bacterium]
MASRHGCVARRWTVSLVLGVCGAATAAGQPMVGVATQSVPVYVEDSLEAAESVEAAQLLLDEGKVTEAVAKLESARRAAAGRLLAVETGRYRDAGLAIDALIASDPRLMSAYSTTQSPAAERLYSRLAPNDLAGMLDLMNSAYLTRWGYEAGLSAVGLLLERAEAGEALRLLDRLETHPLDEPGDRRSSLRAAAARLAGEATDGSAADAAGIDALPWGVADEAVMGREGRAAAVFSAADWSQRLEAGRVRALWRWRVERSATPTARVGRSGDQPDRAVAMPTLTQERVLLNVGGAVVGLDRFSGREVWRLGESSEPEDNAGVQAMRGRLVEPRSVWADRGWGCAVLGTGGLIRQGGRGNVASASTEVVAFNTLDGSLRWRTPIEAMGDTAEGAVLVGTPIVLRDRVVVLLRRSRVTGFLDTVAAGLDRRDGSVAWVRHISSTATSARFTDWPTPSAVEARGLLYVTDRLGAAAAIEAATGRVVWLTVLAEASERARRGVDLRSAGLRYGSGVIPTEAGLIVAVASDASGLTLLDPTDGRRLTQDWRASNEKARVVARNAWALLPIDGDLLAIGDTIGRIDGRRLALAWERPGVLGPGLRGEPMVSGGVLIASGEALVGLDVATGRTVFETETSVKGHVAAGGSLVVVSGADAVEGLLDWGLVSERLIARLERPGANESAEPGLALAFAAWRAGDGERLLRGVEHALAAAGGRADAASAEHVFDTVLPLAQEPGLDDAVRSAVFDRLAGVTETAEQEVALRFARGGALAEAGQTTEALEQYQAVLVDPVLRDQLFEGPTLDRLASLESRARIEALLAEHGRAFYDPYDIAAERRLRALQASDRAEVTGLLDLVASYPLATCGLEALLEAGRLEMDAQRWGPAVRVLRRAYARLPEASSPDWSGEVVGRLVESYVADGRPGSAAAWLHRSRRARPGLALWTAQGETTVEARLAALDARSGAAARPLLEGRRVVSAEVIEGRLMGVASEGETVSGDQGVVLVERGGRLLGLSASTGEPLWQTTFVAPGAVLLSRDDDAAVVWWPSGGRVFGLDLATGQETWPSVAVTAELDRIAAPDDQDMTDAQRRFVRELGPNAAAVAQLRARIARVGGRLVVRAEEPAIARQIAAGGLETTVVADRQGRLLGIDGLSGEVMWRLRTPLRAVSGITAGHGLVAVRGVMFPGEDHQTDAVVVLDAASGQTRLGPLEFHEPVLATALTVDGGLIVVGREEISQRSVADGSLRWRTQLPDEGTLLDVKVGTQSLMMAMRRTADATVALVGLDLESGTQLSGPALIASRSPIAPQLLASDDAWLLAGPSRLLGLHATGQLNWADAATLPDDAGVLAAWLGRDRVVVAYTLNDRGGDASDEHRVLTYELATGRIVDDATVRFAPVEAPALVALTRPEALFLGSGPRTVRLVLRGSTPGE